MRNVEQEFFPPTSEETHSVAKCVWLYGPRPLEGLLQWDDNRAEPTATIEY